jgi:hypothetical protein
MITIELVHEYEEKTEKPQFSQGIPTALPQPGLDEPIYNIALGHQATMLRAAHQARLARAARQQPETAQPEQVPVDVQRYWENPVETRSVLERYTRRLVSLVNRS